jgi:hypothetical protein
VSLALPWTGEAQTKIDLGQQAKGILPASSLPANVKQIPAVTVATLPGSPAPDDLVIVTDCESESSCVTGGGTLRKLLVRTGSAWKLVGDGSPSGTLGDLGVTRTSSTELTLAAGRVRFGNVTYHFETSATATISAGTGTALIYVASDGVLVVGHNGLSVVCGACAVVGSVTQFPADSIPLATWPATAGAWNAAGQTDQRAFLSTKKLIAGLGIQVVESSGHSSVQIDNAVVPIFPIRFGNSAGQPMDCTSSVYGATYFDTTDKRLCICVNDGVVDEWVKSDDYSNATGHCSI